MKIGHIKNNLLRRSLLVIIAIPILFISSLFHCIEVSFSEIKRAWSNSCIWYRIHFDITDIIKRFKKVWVAPISDPPIDNE